MSPADTPDFDSMSPEEVMAWMESLAKRQGANAEGFTTSADMEIGEIDPTTVHIDEPGYVPFGEAPPVKPAAPAAEAAPQQEPEPVAEPEPEPEPEPAASVEEEAELEVSGMDWLESLAADQGVGFDLDLSSLSAELEQASAVESTPAPATNPMDFLEDLAEDQGIDFELEADADDDAVPSLSDAEMAAIDDPVAAGVDPMLWLESLARRQGANQEELTTAADMDVPTPEGVEDTGPGYREFSVEHDPSARTPVEESSDPAAWLESMTTATEDDSTDFPVIEEEEPVAEIDFDGPMTDEQIQQALNTGTEIPHDQMEAFLARQLERQLAGGDIPMEPGEEYDPDAPPIPAEIPEWLLDQVQQSEGEAAQDEVEIEMEIEAETPALLDEIMEPPAVEAALPDWLQDDQADSTHMEMESIFELEDTSALDSESMMDADDPWVQAFTEEATSDPDAIPEWYEQNLNDPDRIAAVEQQMGLEPEASALEEANLPAEMSLPEGEADSVPAWATGAESAPEPAPEVAEEPVADWLEDAEPHLATDEIPNWLAESDIEVQPDEIPNWLLDTVETEELTEDLTIISQAAPPPVAAAEPPAAPPAAPAPKPAAPAAAPPAEVEGLLASAREKASNEDLDGSFMDYERIIRANSALDHVAADLRGMLSSEEPKPAVYRLLGDCLMRQGNLQEALDTYRKALNQL